MPKSGLYDNHVHCDFSIDAVGSVDEYCEAALAFGLDGLTFTTHYDTNPNARYNYTLIRVAGDDLPASIESFAAYANTVLAARKRFAGRGLEVRLGVEFGWYEGAEAKLRELVDAFPLDYVLGGIHEIDGYNFAGRRGFEACFERLTVDQLMSSIANQMIDCARTGLVDTIAHLDYHRKYGLEFYGSELIAAQNRVWPEVFAALRDTDTALEINTSGWRRGFSDPFPTFEIVRAARDAGVRIAHLGSDAHAPDQVGDSFARARPYLSEVSTSDPRPTR